MLLKNLTLARENFVYTVENLSIAKHNPDKHGGVAAALGKEELRKDILRLFIMATLSNICAQRLSRYAWYVRWKRIGGTLYCKYISNSNWTCGTWWNYAAKLIVATCREDVNKIGMCTISFSEEFRTTQELKEKDFAFLRGVNEHASCVSR